MDYPLGTITLVDNKPKPKPKTKLEQIPEEKPFEEVQMKVSGSMS
jgi:hypothetical protein